MGQQFWSENALRIFGAFRRGRKIYGGAIVRETKVCETTVYRVLDRLTEGGYLFAERERIDRRLSAGRPTRTMFVITEAGQRKKRELRKALGR